MKKWEYLTETITIPSCRGEGVYVRNGSTYGELHMYLDEMGSQGWELVGFEGTNYIFKRELVKRPDILSYGMP